MECGLSSIARTALDRDRPASLKTQVSYRRSACESIAVGTIANKDFHHPGKVTIAPPGGMGSVL